MKVVVDVDESEILCYYFKGKERFSTTELKKLVKAHAQNILDRYFNADYFDSEI